MHEAVTRTGVLATFTVTLAVLIYFSNVPSYLYLVEITDIRPVVFVGAFLLLAVVTRLFYPLDSIRLSLSITLWILLFLLVTLAWYAWGSNYSDTAQEITSQRIAGIVGLYFLHLTLVNSACAIRLCRKLVLIGLYVAVVLNVIDYLVPFLFVPPTHEFSNPGRAAGLYVNANLAGAALSVGMLICLPITRGFHRFALIMFTGVGVFLTFSRASMLAWILIVALLTMARMISGKQLASAMVTSFLICAALITTGKSTGIEINVRNIEERLVWFTNPFRTSDASTEERVFVARAAWQMLGDSPVIGYGIGAVSERTGVGPHNAYLEYAVDYGAFGVLLIASLALSLWLVSNSAKNMADRTTIRCFVLLLLITALFRHSIVATNALVLGIAFFASLIPLSRAHIHGKLSFGNSGGCAKQP